MSGTRTRRKCPACGKQVPTFKNGALWRHTDDAGEKCPGAGLPTDHPTEPKDEPTMTDTTATPPTVDDPEPAAPDLVDRTLERLDTDTPPAKAKAAKKPKAATNTDHPAGTPPTFEQMLLGDLTPAPDNPRRDLGDLTELAASIREVGIVEPIVAARNPDGSTTIVAGSRRYAAAQLAGLERAPVIVRPGLDDATRAELALIENLHRKDLEPLEEAEAFARLTGPEFGWSQTKLAGRLGCSQGHISKRLALLKLPDKVRAAIGSTIHVNDAVDLARLPKARVEKVFDDAVKTAKNHRKSGQASSDKPMADTVADELRWSIQREQAALEHDKARRAARKLLNDAGVTIVHELRFYARDDEQVAPMADLRTLKIDPDSHLGCPGHAAHIDAVGRITYVCTTFLAHSPGPAPAGAEASPDAYVEGDGDDAAARAHAEAVAAQEQLRANVATATAMRRNAMTMVLAADLDLAAVAGPYLAGLLLELLDPDNGHYMNPAAMAADLADLLGLPARANREWVPTYGEATEQFGAVRTALAAAMLEDDGELAGWANFAGWPRGVSYRARALLGLLADHGGYELAPHERAALDVPDTEAVEFGLDPCAFCGRRHTDGLTAAQVADADFLPVTNSASCMEAASVAEDEAWALDVLERCLAAGADPDEVEAVRSTLDLPRAVAEAEAQPDAGTTSPTLAGVGDPDWEAGYPQGPTDPTGVDAHEAHEGVEP